MTDIRAAPSGPAPVTRRRDLPGRSAPAFIIRILFVEDHEVFHECMKHLIDLQEGMTMVGTARDGREAVEKAAALRPDIVVMDITMPRLNGLDATRLILKQNPSIKIIALSNHASRQLVQEMFRAGATGYVLKNEAFSELVEAIQSVVSGSPYLSPGLREGGERDGGGGEAFIHLTRREREVLHLISEGRNTKQIAEELNISPKTVETHRINLMKKLDVSTPVELALFALRDGVTPLP